MKKDPTEFRKRFAAWKNGKKPYLNGLPKYEDETTSMSYWDNVLSTAYDIPFISEKKVKLTNAGLSTGAVLSTNLLDSIADNAERARLPLQTAIGLAAKESTLGNPTDDSSVRHILNKARYATFKELGTGQHINYGHDVNGQELINYHKGDNDFAVKFIHTKDSDFEHPIFVKNKSILQTGFEFYRENPDKYNPGQKNYLLLVNRRGEEVMKSPEVQKWLKERNIKKATGRFNRLNPLLNESKFNLPKYAGGKISEYAQIGTDLRYGIIPTLIGGSVYLTNK